MESGSSICLLQALLRIHHRLSTTFNPNSKNDQSLERFPSGCRVNSLKRYIWKKIHQSIQMCQVRVNIKSKESIQKRVPQNIRWDPRLQKIAPFRTILSLYLDLVHIALLLQIARTVILWIHALEAEEVSLFQGERADLTMQQWEGRLTPLVQETITLRWRWTIRVPIHVPNTKTVERHSLQGQIGTRT